MTSKNLADHRDTRPTAGPDRSMGTPDAAAAGDADASRNPDSGPGWLLAGKLAPPEQRIIVASRHELLTRLDASLNRSVSVIVSPPGFGKTTLLTQWWRSLETRDSIHACWLTLDEIDSEVSRFVAGVILSVARAGVDVAARDC